MGTGWIAVDKTLPFKPEIAVLARVLKITRAEVVVACFRLWAWADDMSVNGELGELDFEAVDEAVAVKGFGEAMIDVGWLEVRVDGCFVIPNWDAWNSKSAKARILSARRNSRLRRRT